MYHLVCTIETVDSDTPTFAVVQLHADLPRWKVRLGFEVDVCFWCEVLFFLFLKNCSRSTESPYYPRCWKAGDVKEIIVLFYCQS